ncbi:DUF503 family protein [Chloroflexota bacterium]
MNVDICKIKLRLPKKQPLKDKRCVIRSIIARV